VFWSDISARCAAGHAAAFLVNDCQSPWTALPTKRTDADFCSLGCALVYVALAGGFFCMWVLDEVKSMNQRYFVAVCHPFHDHTHVQLGCRSIQPMSLSFDYLRENLEITMGRHFLRGSLRLLLPKRELKIFIRLSYGDILIFCLVQRLCRCMGCFVEIRGVFQDRGPIMNFSRGAKTFFPGGEVVKFHFGHSELRNQPCCANNLIQKCQILKSGWG